MHRGAFFVELRTTTVRKLLPESWGFMCPVHTPDGGPCGLLNHLTAMCQVVPHGPEEPEVVARAICEVRLSESDEHAFTCDIKPIIVMFVPMAVVDAGGSWNAAYWGAANNRTAIARHARR